MGKKKKLEVVVFNGNYKKSNEMILAKGNLTLYMQRLFMIGLYRIKKDTDGRYVARITRGELEEILPSGNTVMDMVTTAADQMQNYKLVFKDPETNTFESYVVIPTCKYKEGVLEYIFNNDLAEDRLITLKNNYTTFELTEMLSFSSPYTIRLYEIIKSEYDRLDAIAAKNGLPCQQPYMMTIDFIDLKMTLGVVDAGTDKRILKAINNDDFDTIEQKLEKEGKNKYEDYGSLNKNVLKPAQKKIKENTDYFFTISKHGKGRGGKVKSVTFAIYRNHPRKDTKAASIESREDVLDQISEIIEEKLKVTDYRKIAEAAGYDVGKVKKAYEVAQESPRVKNLVAFLLSAIKEDYEPSVEKKRKKKNSFNNFDQHLDIDFQELEKQLLDN